MAKNAAETARWWQNKRLHHITHFGGPMRQFVIEQSAADLTSHAGLGLIGRALHHQTDLADAATAVSDVRPDAIQHRDILASDIALVSTPSAH
jgi:hypothetical protein